MTTRPSKKGSEKVLKWILGRDFQKVLTTGCYGFYSKNVLPRKVFARGS